MIRAFAALLFLCALPTMAATLNKDGNKIYATLTRAECQRLVVNHQASGDVSYKPGVSADGSYVEPATLGGDKDFDLAKTIKIPIEIDLVEIITHPLSENQELILNSNDIVFGDIIIHESGQITMNDIPLKDSVGLVFTKACHTQFPNL